MELQGKAILILPDDNPEETQGGIAIPKTVKKKPISGKVVDVGPAVEEVSKGDKVLYARKAASKITVGETEYHFAMESMISYIF